MGPNVTFGKEDWRSLQSYGDRVRSPEYFDLAIRGVESPSTKTDDPPGLNPCRLTRRRPQHWKGRQYTIQIQVPGQ